MHAMSLETYLSRFLIPPVLCTPPEDSAADGPHEPPKNAAHEITRLHTPCPSRITGSVFGRILITRYLLPSERTAEVDGEWHNKIAGDRPLIARSLSINNHVEQRVRRGMDNGPPVPRVLHSHIQSRDSQSHCRLRARFL